MGVCWGILRGLGSKRWRWLVGQSDEVCQAVRQRFAWLTVGS